MIMPHMNRALFLACTRRKVPGAKPLPAVQRYDGPCFRVLRRYLRCKPDAGLRVWAISARFGLISAATPIPAYDAPMTSRRAEELRSAVLAKFLEGHRRHPFDEAFACLGKNYAQAMSDCWQHVREGAEVFLASGGIGGQSSQLRTWLGRSNEFGAMQPARRSADGAAILGVAINMDAKLIIDLARRKRAEDPKGASRFQTWFVPVGRHRVAPKWLVHVLTGLPVSRFRAADARRVLTQLGLPVLPVWQKTPTLTHV